MYNEVGYTDIYYVLITYFIIHTICYKNWNIIYTTIILSIFYIYAVL